MRYSILRYTKTLPNSFVGFIDPILGPIYSSFKEAEDKLQWLYTSGQTLHSERINTTDKSARVWRSLKPQDSDSYVIILREDNPYFAFAPLMYAFTWYHEPFKRYNEPRFNMIRDYLARTTDRPELFKDLNS